jgi:hypothetical protein
MMQACKDLHMLQHLDWKDATLSSSRRPPRHSRIEALRDIRESKPSATFEVPSRRPPRRARQSANVRHGYRYSQTSALWVQEVS